MGILVMFYIWRCLRTYYQCQLCKMHIGTPVLNEETSIMMLLHMPHNAIYAIHTMPFMQENTIFGQLMADPQLG